MTHVVTLAVVAMVLTLVMFHPIYVTALEMIQLKNGTLVENMTANPEGREVAHTGPSEYFNGTSISGPWIPNQK